MLTLAYTSAESARIARSYSLKHNRDDTSLLSNRRTAHFTCSRNGFILLTYLE